VKNRSECFLVRNWLTAKNVDPVGSEQYVKRCETIIGLPTVSVIHQIEHTVVVTEDGMQLIIRRDSHNQHPAHRSNVAAGSARS
jgi:hypothetical protein